MRVLVCTGDSHTWGQGAKGIENQDMPRLFGSEGVCGGDLRPVPFEEESYVGRIRAALGGEYREYSADDLGRIWNVPVETRCAHVQGDVRLDIKGGLARVFIKRTTGGGVAQVALDAQRFCRGTGTETEAWNGTGMFPVCIRAEDGTHTLTVSGDCLVYRVEVYSGEWAVVNGGVGSCSAGEYIKTYFDDYVAACGPDALLMEGHTINDWLRPQTPDMYRSDLARLLKMGKGTGAEVYLLTVSPVLGEQVFTANEYPYEAFAAAAYEAAKDADVRVIDSHAHIAERMNEAGMYSDNWHVSSLGHAIYAQDALRAISK